MGCIQALPADGYGLHYRRDFFHRCRIAQVSQWEDRVGTREFASVAENQSGILQIEINQYLSRLFALRALFSPRVTRSAGNNSRSSRIRSCGINTATQSVSWIPRVPHTERATRERAAVDDGIPDYQIKAVGLGPGGSLAPSPERDEYFPIFYSTEKPKTSPVFGIDLASERKRRETLERAGRNEPTSHVRGLRTPHRLWRSIWLYCRAADVSTRSAVRHRGGTKTQSIGFVQGAFQTSVMIETILAAAPEP